MSLTLGLVSDIHGNLPALDACLAALADCDLVWCLGDVVDLGPEPAAVIERLSSANIPTIRGNHDRLDESPALPFLADLEAWTADVLSAADRAWLASRPFRLDLEAHGVVAVHGSPEHDTDQILDVTPAETLSRWCTGARVLVCGHTHVQLDRTVGGCRVVNAGSVGMPFQQAFFPGGPPPVSQRWAECARIRLGAAVDVELLKVDYDFADFIARVRASSMPHHEAYIAQYAD